MIYYLLFIMINHQFKFTLLQRETHSGILRIALARLVGDAIRLSTPFGSQRHSALNAIRLSTPFGSQRHSAQEEQ